ncbi:MAG: DUF63 family protein, partial [Candidatus Nanohaloarchaea archaeon]
MKEVLEERWKLLIGPLGLLVLFLGVVIRPHLVYDRFIWKYFWGPIAADATNQATVMFNGVVAHRGYNLVNEVGYALMLLYGILLLVNLLRRFDVGEEKNFILAFVPFIVGGGLLRVLEDAALVGTPWRYLIISPVIYFSLFVLVLAALLLSLKLEREGLIGSYRKGVAAAGTVFSIGVLLLLLFQEPLDAVWILPASLGLASLVFTPSYLAFRRTGLERLVDREGSTVLFSHLLDGSATALSISLLGYGEKHPVVRFVMGSTGTPYSFIAVKLAVISGVLYYMD